LLVLVLIAPSYAGQVVITHGGVYNSQLFYNGNPNVAAVDIQTTEFVYFYNCTFESAGLAVRAFSDNSNIWIERCTFRLPGTDAVEVHNPARFIMAHSLIDHARNAVVVADWRATTSAPVTIAYNRITNCQGDGHAILICGLHQDPNISATWNEITNQFGYSKPSDAIDIYLSSGLPGRPIKIWYNYIAGVVPVNPNDPTFNSCGVVTDGDTFNPALATAHIDIAYNQVVGCPYTGIALALGLHQIAHDNTIVSAGLTQYGTPVRNSAFGACIEGDHRYQPAEWLNWLQLINNAISINGIAPTFTWYHDLSDQYVYGNRTNGNVTLADEQAQWTAWKQKLATYHVTVGP
jgi:hypothetical protein